ncbi:MAG: flagellar hook-length control protein FliK [Pseudomonadota bacterium]
MQTPKLPLPAFGALPGAAPAMPQSNGTHGPNGANGAQMADAAQFSRTLTRQIEQRHAASAPPKAAQAAPKQFDSAPGEPAADAAPEAGAGQGASAGQAAARDERAEQALDTQRASDVAAIAPVTDMMMLAASLHRPQPNPAASDPALAAAPVAAPGTAIDGTIERTIDSALAAKADPAGGAQKDKAAGGFGETLAAAAQADPRARAGEPGLLQALAGKAQPEPELAAAKPAAGEPSAIGADAPASPLGAQVQQLAALAQARPQGGTDKVAARVGTPGWNNQVGQRIVWMVAGKEQSASLTLNPPELGPMQVVLSVTGDQTSITFSSAQPEVRQALENALPRLRELMNESGIALGNASVNAGMPDAQAGAGARGDGGDGRRSAGQIGQAGDAGEPVRVGERALALGGGVGLVDTFA